MYNFVFLCIFLRENVWVYFGIYLGDGGLWLVVLLTLVFFCVAGYFISVGIFWILFIVLFAIAIFLLPPPFLCN